MGRDKLLCISVILLWTCTNAAPSVTSKWHQLATDNKFQKYQATLLNPAVMPFLNTCYSPTCCQEADDYRCNLYFDAVTWAQEVEYTTEITKDFVKNLAPESVMNFCSALESSVKKMSSNFGHAATEGIDHVSKMPTCIMLCGNFTTSQAIATCEVSLWLLNSTQAELAARRNADLRSKLQTSAGKGEDAANPAQSASDGHIDGADIPAQPKPLVKVPLQIAKTETNVVPAAGKQNESVASLPSKTKPSQSEKPTPKIATPEEVIPEDDPQSPPAKNEPAPGQQPTKETDANKNSKGAPPRADIKSTTTDSSPPVVNQDVNLNDKPLEPGTPDYDDEDGPSNENRQSQLEQTDESNEIDDSMVKMDKSDISQPQSIGQFGHGHRDSQDTVIVDNFKEEPGSNFFYYFLFGMFLCIVGYIVYDNRTKILALMLEGRRSQSGRGGRRKHTAAYRKLDTNLEEAIMSSAPSGRTSQIIY